MLKVLLAYHKPFPIISDKVFVPIHVGRQSCEERALYNIKYKHDLAWLKRRMIGDNTGDNISPLNSYLCETTAMYWAWKNYISLGNPDYIGFMHYRRHFILKSPPIVGHVRYDMIWREGSCVPYTIFDETKPYRNAVGLYGKKYEDIFSDGTDLAEVAPLHYPNITVYDHFFQLTSPPYNFKIEDFNTSINLLKKMYPKYTVSADAYLNQDKHTQFNIFITRKEIFFDFSSWLFPLLFELLVKGDYSKRQPAAARAPAYIAERLCGIYFYHLKRTGQIKTKAYRLSRVIQQERANVSPFQLFAKHQFYRIASRLAVGQKRLDLACKRKYVAQQRKHLSEFGTIKAVISKIEALERRVKLFEPVETLYRSNFERKFIHDFPLFLKRPDLHKKFMDLINNLDERSRDTVVNILQKLQRFEKNNKILDIYDSSEKKCMHTVIKDFQNSILELSPGVFYYGGYFLPINHFEIPIFLYNCNINYIKNIEHIVDKDIIDAGAYIGDSALILSQLTKKNVYAFEPVPENISLMEKTLMMNSVRNIINVPSALGATSGTLDMFAYGSSSTETLHSNSNIPPDNTIQVPVTTVDQYVAEHNLSIGLIKTDVEGAEQALLHGAMNTIKQQKPVLLISIYHNMSDFFDIKPMIAAWNLGYQFKVVKPITGHIILETMLIAEVPRLPVAPSLEMLPG